MSLPRIALLAAVVSTACAPSPDRVELVEPSRPEGAPPPVRPALPVPGAISAERDSADAPRFVPYDQAPVLENRREIARALEALYPPELKRSGISGTTRVWAWVDEYGIVQEARVHTPSGHSELDFTAIRVVRLMRFEPASFRDSPLAVWIQIPVSFSTRRRSTGERP